MNLTTLTSLTSLALLRPWWLLTLLPLGVLLWRLWRAPLRSDAAWRGLIDAHLRPHLLVFSGARARHGGLALFGAGLLTTVLALAGPAQERQQPETGYRRDVMRLLVLDLSPAMTAQLEPVKLKLLALLQALPDGQTALLVYGAEPYLVVPPTTDVATIALFVPELASDAIPQPGNRPERALHMAGKILARSAVRQREVLWITAGAGNAELPLTQLSGARLSILHAATAHDQALAAAVSPSGGTLVQLRADNGDVDQLAAALAARGGAIAGAQTATGTFVELGHWLLLPLLAVAALAFRGGILTLLLPLLLAGALLPQPAWAFDFPLTGMLADYQAWRLLDAGEPEAAAARFADPRWRAAASYRAGQFDQAASLLASASDADSHYNRGNALARQGQLAAALSAYDAALKLRAVDADSRYNRELVQRLLNQQTPKGGAGAKSRQPGAGQQAPKQAPPAPNPGPGQGQNDDAGREAARVAQQWLRRIPDEPGSLLRRKLQAEQRRRQAGEVVRLW